MIIFVTLSVKQTKTDLLNKIVSVIQSDPLTQFPVSKPHKKSTLKWISKVFCSDSIPVPKEISNTLNELGHESGLPEPEFIFKTFDRGSSVFVTLLEENRDIIGHGTTGLTSWQGALFLSDWAQYHVNKLKVKYIGHLNPQHSIHMHAIILWLVNNSNELTCKYRWL